MPDARRRVPEAPNPNRARLTIKKDKVVIQNGNNFTLVNFKDIEPDIGNILTDINIQYQNTDPKTIEKWKKGLPIAYKKFIDVFDINSLNKDFNIHKKSFNKFQYAKKAVKILKQAK